MSNIYKAGDVVVNRRGDVVTLESCRKGLYYWLEGAFGDARLYINPETGECINKVCSPDHDIVGYHQKTPKIDNAEIIDRNGVARPFDDVSNPPHYTRLSPEPIDVIAAWGLNFNLGNVVKYIARAGHKDEVLKELKKAYKYLGHEIERLENKE
jgi:hypothetical protein